MSWIQLYNSEYFDFSRPEKSIDKMSIETVAHSLAHQCRYNGHCNKFYSVAEHSCHVADRAYELSGGADHVALAALLHDASEAILCDLPRPLKWQEGAQWYLDWEREVQNAFMYTFCIKWRPSKEVSKLVKQADFELLATEKEQVMSESPLDWGHLPKPLDIQLTCYLPAAAKKQFLNYYKRLSRSLKWQGSQHG